MKLKSVSGFTVYANDLQKTSKFYSDLGFTKVHGDSLHVSFRLNWFVIDFIDASEETKEEFKKDSEAKDKGRGVYFDISVDDVDQVYKEVLELGYEPSSAPRDWPWGNREFVLKDPDGYKLVFMQKI